MQRIYLDKQIFSYLFKGTDDTYKKLLNELYLSKNSSLFCYSHAHLLDLKNDKTDIKYKELEFMETLVGDNYLCYYSDKKYTLCYLASPTNAFRNVENEIDADYSFSAFMDDIDESCLTEEQKEEYHNAKRTLSELNFDFGLTVMQSFPDEIKKPLAKLFPLDARSMTFLEWAEYFLKGAKTMEEDKSVYKELRAITDKYINNGKFTIDYNSIDFNDELKTSVLKKSFVEYVNGNINPNGDKKVTDYDFFTNAYFTLDLLGISKEPSKNVRFRNVMNDGFHSYYGAFCDFVVSDDNGFLNKTRAMYKLLDIDTKVFHIDDFIIHYPLLCQSEEDSLTTFLKLLAYDLRHGIAIRSKPSLQYNRHTTTIKPYHLYLGYFNQLDNVKEDGQDYIFLTRKTHNYSTFAFYREYEGVINKAIKLFGDDMQRKGNFDWLAECQEIQSGTWNGRSWNIGNMTIQIEINRGTDKLCLVISIND